MISGFYKLFCWEVASAYMASHKVPVVPLFLLFAISLELGAGLSVMLGYRAEVGSLLLLIYLIPVTLIFHPFWALDGMESQTQVINFLKNVSLAGGLLLIGGHGAGPINLDDRF